MGLGSTAKKLQTVTEVAEKMYGRINDLREEVDELRATARETSDRVERLESEIAREQGIDVDAVSASSHIVDAEGDAPAESEADDATADTDD